MHTIYRKGSGQQKVGGMEWGQGTLGQRTQSTLTSVLSSPLSDPRLDPSLALGKVARGNIKPAQLPAQAWSSGGQGVDGPVLLGPSQAREVAT